MKRLPSVKISAFLLLVICAFFTDGKHLLPTQPTAEAQLVITQPFKGSRRDIEINVRLSSYYGYGWYTDAFCGGRYCGYYGNYGIGPGFQMIFPILKNGFIPSLNNAFYLGFFTDFQFHPDGAGRFSSEYGFFSIPVGIFAQWRFYLLEKLSLFVNVGGGVWPWIFSSNNVYYHDTIIRGFPLFEIGANFHFAKHVGLNVTLGYPAARVGLNIAF